MTRQQAFDRLPDYAYGEMSAEDAVAFEVLLREDPELRAALDEIRFVRGVVARVPEPELPSAVRRRILDAAEGAALRQSWAARWERVQAFLGAPAFLGAAAVIVAAGVGIQVLIQDGPLQMRRVERPGVEVGASAPMGAAPAGVVGEDIEGTSPVGTASATMDEVGEAAAVGGLASAQEAPVAIVEESAAASASAGAIADGGARRADRARAVAAGRTRATPSLASAPRRARGQEAWLEDGGGVATGQAAPGDSQDFQTLAERSPGTARAAGAFRPQVSPLSDAAGAAAPRAEVSGAVVSGAEAFEDAVPRAQASGGAVPRGETSAGFASPPTRAASKAATALPDADAEAVRGATAGAPDLLDAARQARASGDLGGALALCRSALAARPSGRVLADVLAEAAEIALLLGRHAEAERHLERLERLPGGQDRAATIRDR